MSKLFALVLALALLAGAFASAEGILPVLQTPVPQITEAVSYHYFRNIQTPTANLKDGSYYYSYSGIKYGDYLLFGQALAQEGYTLTGSETAEDGTGAVIATMEKAGAATLKIKYDDDKHRLTVYYPPSVEAMEADQDHPYTIDGTLASVLPELKQMISLHAATWINRPSGDDDVKKRAEGGYQYYYPYVPYAAYRRFSIKLGEAGYTLVSSGKTEDGQDMAVVTDGEDEMTIVYDQEHMKAFVSYPPSAHARDRAFPEDYDIVRDGEPFLLGDNITATITGWEPVDQFYYQYHGTDVFSKDGIQLIIILMDIDYRQPTGTQYNNLLNLGIVCIGDRTESIFTFGRLRKTEPYYDIQRGYDEITGKTQFQAAIALELPEEAAADPAGIAVTFSGMDNYVPYVYYLQPPEAE